MRLIRTRVLILEIVTTLVIVPPCLWAADRTRIGIMKFTPAELYEHFLRAMEETGKFTVVDSEEVEDYVRDVLHSKPYPLSSTTAPLVAKEFNLEHIYVVGSKVFPDEYLLTLIHTGNFCLDDHVEESIFFTVEIVNPNGEVEFTLFYPIALATLEGKNCLLKREMWILAQLVLMEPEEVLNLQRMPFWKIRILLKALGEPVLDAQYTSLKWLGEGRRGTQEQQKKAVEELKLPLEIRTRKTGIVFRLVPPGAFEMVEEGKGSLQPVRFEKPFYMGKYEITQGQWQRVMGNNPSCCLIEEKCYPFSLVPPVVLDEGNASGPDKSCGYTCVEAMDSPFPLENASWAQCLEFCKCLCEREGVPERTFWLPTSEEWEYGCRAGTSGSHAGDIDKMAWHDGNSHDRTHKVGTKVPNAWGLYDMQGNIDEYLFDGLWTRFQFSSERQAVFDAYLRGGSWLSSPEHCACSGSSQTHELVTAPPEDVCLEELGTSRWYVHNEEFENRLFMSRYEISCITCGTNGFRLVLLFP